MLQDIKLAFRQIGKYPTYSFSVMIASVLMVTLVATAFSVIHAVAYKPLPYTGEEKIFYLKISSPQSADSPTSYPEYLDLAKRFRTLSAIAGFNSLGSVNITTDIRTVPASSVEVTSHFFDALGARADLGILPSEFPVDSQNAVLSYGLAKQIFPELRSPVGAAFHMNGNAYTVSAVLSRDFRFPLNQRNTIYVPLSLTKQKREGRSNYWLFAIARLQDGTKVQQAEGDVKRVFASLARDYRDSAGRTAELIPIRTYSIGDASLALRLLFWAVAIMLLIDCVNLAGLVFMRSMESVFALTIRKALGASSWQLLRLRGVECGVYTVLAGGVGLLIAAELLQILHPLLTNALTRGSEVELSPSVAFATMGAVLVTNLIGTLLTMAFRGTAQVLRSGARHTQRVSGVRWRTSVVVGQIALAICLVTTCGILISSLRQLQEKPLGFDPGHVLTSEVILSPRYSNNDVLSRFYEPLLNRIQAVPGVKGAGLIQMLPIRAWGWNQTVSFVGQPRSSSQSLRLAEIRMVTPGLYNALGQRLVKGRMFDQSKDSTTSQAVVIVNEAFVKQLVPRGTNPIGLQIADEDSPETIVGVVQDVTQNVYDPPMPEMDEPISQCPVPMRTAFLSRMNLVVRTAQSPASIVPELRNIFGRVDPETPFREPELMTAVVSERLTLDQLQAWVLSSFALSSSALALIGLYASLGYYVALSRKDIAIRLALGATTGSILWWCYRKVGIMLLCGTVAGTAFALLSRRILNLGGINATTSSSAGIFLCIFALLAVLAAYVPAKRAIGMDPLNSLREE